MLFRSGLSAQGANDQIRTKTFGTAPNRQFWIQFNSFSCPSSTGWTYWAIALEETSNKIYVVDQRSYNAPLSLTIGLQYNSTSALAVTGSPNLGSNATWYADDTPIDNSYFEFVPGQQAANEIELSSIDNSPYVIAPGSVDIKGTVTNYGSTPITSFNVKYEFNGNTYTDTKSGLNIPFAGTYSFTHATPANLPAVGNYPVKVWVELTGDANHVNDTLNQTLIGMLFVPQKKVVVEEATGTWCGWCPRGAVYMDSLHNLHPNDAMLVAVHNSDPMVVASYDAWMGTQIGGYPSGLVDRKDIDIDPTQFIASYDVHINDIAPCDVDVIANYNPSNNYAWITVSAHFAGDVNGDLRLGLILTEDDVTGTSSAYNQANYYSNTSQNLPLQGAGHNWQLEPNPVPAANMTYNQIGRAHV